MKYKKTVVAGALVASLGILTGCEAHYETNLNGDKHSYEYDSDAKEFVEVNPEDEDEKESEGVKDGGKKEDAEPKDDDKTGTADVKGEEYGFASSDEAIIAFWQGMEDCSEEEIKACFLGEDVFSRNQYKVIQSVIDDMAEKADSVKDTVIFYIDHISIDKDSVDPEDLPSHITEVTDVEKAYICVVVVPITQTINGDDYEVNDKYEMYTIKVDGRWYIDTQLNEIDAEVVGRAGGSVSVSDEKEWCSISRTTDSVKCVYTNGISDSYEIADGVTFDDLCDWFEKESPAFDRENYRHVVSLNFGNESTFAAMKKLDISRQASVLGSLAEFTRRIDKVEGKTLEMEVNASDPDVYVFKVQCASYGNCELYLNSQTGELKMIQPSTGNESEGTITDQDVAGWEDAARHALNGEQP